MTRRPRLANNLRAPRPPAPLDHGGALTVLETREAPVPMSVEPVFQATPMIALEPARESRATPGFADVWGNAVVAMGLAASLVWTQGLTVQFRLASHLLNLRPPAFRIN